jgi:hypothetical protein
MQLRYTLMSDMSAFPDQRGPGLAVPFAAGFTNQRRDGNSVT